MGDIFLAKEARAVLANKHIAIIGGSNMRGLYKDIVWLINDDSIIPKEVLGDKSEARFPDFDGQKWKKSRNKISARLRKKFKDNQDRLLGNEGTCKVEIRNLSAGIPTTNLKLPKVCAQIRTPL